MRCDELTVDDKGNRPLSEVRFRAPPGWGRTSGITSGGRSLTTWRNNGGGDFIRDTPA